MKFALLIFALSSAASTLVADDAKPRCSQVSLILDPRLDKKSYIGAGDWSQPR